MDDERVPLDLSQLQELVWTPAARAAFDELLADSKPITLHIEAVTERRDRRAP